VKKIVPGMERLLGCRLAAVGIGVAALLSAGSAAAQKQGGTLRVYHPDSPPSMSIHEEVTISTNVPMMGVFNNLVVYDQHVTRPQRVYRRIDRASSAADSVCVRPDLGTVWVQPQSAGFLRCRCQRTCARPSRCRHYRINRETTTPYAHATVLANFFDLIQWRHPPNRSFDAPQRRAFFPEMSQSSNLK
jgi:hypothetical protein